MVLFQGLNIWIGLQFVFSLYISGIHASVDLDEDSLAKIDSFIQAAMACHHIPGLSVAVVNKDQALLQKGYGYADVIRKKPVTKETLFPIASTTKAFTTAVLAMLLEKTDFTWDTPLKEIDPKFKLHSDLLTSHVTLRDILTHRTGIPGYFIAIMAGYPDDLSMEDIIRNFHYHPPTEPLRTEFRYNNYMYGLAGYIAELMADSSWQDIVSEKIFGPLNMTDSTFVNRINIDSEELKMAKPYVYKDNETVEIDLTSIRQVNIASPAGAIISNAMDMSSWIQFHLRQGQLPSGMSLMSTDSLESLYKTPIGGSSVLPDMTKPSFPVSDIGQTYALAWINNIYRGYRRVWHSGGILTYKSQVWLLPGLEAGIFLVANGPNTSGSWAMVHIAQYITDLLAGETPWLNTTTVCTFPFPWKENKRDDGPDQTEQLTSHPLPMAVSCYTGSYTHPAFGKITISTHPSQNKLTMKMGLYMEADLSFCKQNDTFYTKFTNKYWYMNDQIPLQFRNLRKVGIANTYSTILMPLCQPYDSANKLSFEKDLDEYSILLTSERVHNKASGVQTSFINIYIQILLFLSLSTSYAAY